MQLKNKIRDKFKQSKLWHFMGRTRLHMQSLVVSTRYAGAASYAEPTEIDLFLGDKKVAKTKSVLWVGTNRNQDYSGTIQALEHVAGTVKLFTKSDGSYGLEKPGLSRNNKCIENNSTRIVEIVDEMTDLGDQPDIILGQMLGSRVDEDVLSGLKGRGIKIVNIAMDDKLPWHWLGKNKGRKVGAVQLANSIDLTVTTDLASVNRYRALGAVCEFFPLASDPSNLRSEFSSSKDIDICFVGNNYGSRKIFVDAIEKSGLNIEVRGAGWPKGSVDKDEMFELFSRSKIVLGIGYISYSKSKTTQKLRDFDVLMCGACYLTSFNKELDQFYKNDEDILFYDTVEEMVEIARSILSDDEHREKIGASARRKSIKYHQWFHRIGSLVNYVS